MSKRVSISRYPLKTATVLLALAIGVFSSRADYWEWGYPTFGVTDPTQIGGTDAVYNYGDSYSHSESGSGGLSTVSWSGDLYADSSIVTRQVFDPQAIHTGHSLFISATSSAIAYGGEMSDGYGPPSSWTVAYTANAYGQVYAKTDVGQRIDPADGTTVISSISLLAQVPGLTTTYFH